MIKRRIILALILTVAAPQAFGDGIYNPGAPSVGQSEGINNGGSGGGSTCSHSLDFSKACNSQYLTVLH